MIKTVVFHCFLVVMAPAQIPSFLGIQGQLTATAGGLPDHLSVEVTLEGRAVQRTAVESNGSFELRNITAGRYELRVLNFYGDVLRVESVMLDRNTPRIDVRLPGVQQQRPASGSVSLRSLTNPLSKAVQKELQRAEKASSQGDFGTALVHLNRAMGECSRCVEVHNNLGVLHLRTNAIDEAVRVLGLAVELDPDSVLAGGNLAIALLLSKQYDRAEAVSRHVLKLDAGSAAARYSLGLVALSRKDCSTEAVNHLRAAADKIPRAHLPAAQLLECRGESKQAMAELAAYLQQPDAAERAQVEGWLLRLGRQAR